MHGGCIFTLADTVGGCAAWTRGSYVATASSNINYLNAAIDCKKVVAIAREMKAGKKFLVYEVDIFDDKDNLIAKVSNTYCSIKKKLDF